MQCNFFFWKVQCGEFPFSFLVQIYDKYRSFFFSFYCTLITLRIFICILYLCYDHVCLNWCPLIFQNQGHHGGGMLQLGSENVYTRFKVLHVLPFFFFFFQATKEFLFFFILFYFNKRSTQDSAAFVILYLVSRGILWSVD